MIEPTIFGCSTNPLKKTPHWPKNREAFCLNERLSSAPTLFGPVKSGPSSHRKDKHLLWQARLAIARESGSA